MNKIAIVGTISNVESVLRSDLNRVVSALNDLHVSDIFLVESDSDDQTSTLIMDLKKTYSNLAHVNLGILKNHIPNRIERIRYCRNYYVRWLRENSVSSPRPKTQSHGQGMCRCGRRMQYSHGQHSWRRASFAPGH